MSKLDKVLKVLGIKVEEEFKLKRGDDYFYTVRETGDLYFRRDWEHGYTMSVHTLADLIVKFDIVKVITPERVAKLGLKMEEEFEFLEAWFMKFTECGLMSYDEKDGWIDSPVITVERIEAEPTAINKIPYHPKEGSVIHFLDGCLENPVVGTAYYSKTSYILDTLESKGLLFSSPEGALWSREKFK